MNANLIQNGRHLCGVNEIISNLPSNCRLAENRVFWVRTPNRPDLAQSIEHKIQIPEFQEVWTVKIKDSQPIGDDFLSEAVLLRLRALRHPAGGSQTAGS